MDMDLALYEEHSQQKVWTEPLSSSLKSSKRVKKCASLKVKIKSKPTVKDMKTHRSIFKEGVIAEGTDVVYMSKGKEMLKGKKQGCGILCSCCKEEISASQFEAHAGRPKRKKPYENIFFLNGVFNGVSLHELSSDLKRTGKHLALKNDEVCGVCQKGGDLLLCDGCPRLFHIECIFDTRAPLEKWFCKHCRNSMKGLGPISSDVAGGMVSGINVIEEVVNCSVQMFENPNKDDLVACSLCRSYEFSVDGFNDQTVIVCDQCESEFHIGCLRESYKANLKELPPGSWFCSVECGILNHAVKVLVKCGAQTVPHSLMHNIPNHDIKWVIVHRKQASEDSQLLLAAARDIFHDRFNPITDSVTKKDIIQPMTYGEKMDDSDFAGVHCAMLTNDSKVITAGLFRVFGHEIVELPIVATSQEYQKEGYFKVFMKCFEKLLSFLKIQKLIVPAAEDTKAMWTNKFGFRIVTPLQQCEYRQKHTSMVTFTGTSLLEKEVPESSTTFEINPLFDLNMG